MIEQNQIILSKIYWRVIPKPKTGAKRPWPRAFYPDGTLCALLSCKDPYGQRLASVKDHRPLTLTVVSPDNPKVALANRTFGSLTEAKEGLIPLLKTNKFVVLPDSSLTLSVCLHHLRTQVTAFDKHIRSEAPNGVVATKTLSEWEKQFKEFLHCPTITESA